MSDLPKHPADPANELASDNSAIDPRDFRNALGTFAHRRYHRHGDGGRRNAIRGDLQLLCLGIAESAAGAVESRHVFAGPDHFPECQPFHRQCARRFAAGARRAVRKILSRQIRRSELDAGARQRAGARRQRRQFSVSCRQPLLWRRPRYFLGAVEAYAYNRQEPLLFANGGFGRFISDDGKKSS